MLSSDLSAGYGAQVDIKLTNGATGPTVAAQVQIQVAADTGGTLFVNFGGLLSEAPQTALQVHGLSTFLLA